MRGYFEKTPVTVIFENNQENSDLIDKFHSNTVFRYKKPTNEYFPMFSLQILQDRDPFEIIENYYPDLEGFPKIVIKLISGIEQVVETSDDFTFHVSLDRDIEFQVQEIVKVLINRAEKNKNKNFYSKINSFLKGDLELGNAKFMNKDYKGAFQEFNKLIQTAYTRRMILICQKLQEDLSIFQLSDDLSVDLIVLNDKPLKEYSFLNKQSDLIKFALQYYLTKQDIQRSLKMLFLFECKKKFGVNLDNLRSERCKIQLKDIVEELKDCSEKGLNKKFYSELLELI